MKENNTTTSDRPQYVIHNTGLTGKKFGSGHGMAAMYIDYPAAPKGFRMMCESMPHHGDDHIIYGRRTDGQYIGIGQPYPLTGDRLHDINEYCHAVGLEMLMTGHSTWDPGCLRILFQRDDKNIERFNIAINNARWHNDYPSRCDTDKIVAGVNKRLAACERRSND